MKTLNSVTVMYCRQHRVHCDPAIWQASFNLPRRTGSLLNCIQTGQGQGLANLHRWSKSAARECQQQQQSASRHMTINKK